MPPRKKLNTADDDAGDEKVYETYFSLFQKYTLQYGENTVLLMQVGSFFEIYGDKLPTGEIRKSNIETVCKICRLEIAEKKVRTPTGVLVMAGFRDYALEKFVEILIGSEFTVVVYDQKPNPVEKGKMIREHYRTYSPGTYLTQSESVHNDSVSNNIMCIWFELVSGFRDSETRFICGMATAHIFSGETSMFEYETTWSLNATTFDELERYISVFSPSEIILISGLDESITIKAEQFAGIYGRNVHRVLLSDNTDQALYAHRCEKQVYINEILENIYGFGVYRQCREFQEYSMATQSLCYLLNFLQEHNPDLVKKLITPVFTNSSTRMILANHTLQQLNIISCDVNGTEEKNRYSSVYSLLNECKTSMGKRRFHRELTSPTINESWLETQYSNTETHLKYSKQIKDNIREKLGGIIDIEKWLRQLILHKNTPKTFVGLHRSLLNTEYLLEKVFTEKTEELLFTKECIKYINRHFHIEKCVHIDSMTNFSENFICRGISQELDKTTDLYVQLENQMNRLHAKLNELLSETDYVKIHHTEKSGISLQITNTRSNILKTALSKHPILKIDTDYSIPTENIHFKKIGSSSSIVEIESNEIHKLIRNLNSAGEKLNAEIAKVYLQILVNIESEIYNRLEYIADTLSELDVLQCRAFVAEKYRLCKPAFMPSEKNTELQQQNEPESSGFQVKGLRHILIEQIQTDEIYVENDLTMSADYENAPTGILLFGTNAVGKTSFIRALGVAVIMAQAGFYVSASSFEYKPYTAIYSRIWGNDNLFKGLSTFAVEMSELRVILNMSDKNSLILGDELCSGTETESALSIFSAGLEYLSKKGATYLFATHFHEITSWDEVRMLNGLVFKHMSVHYNREIDGLVYDRKLKDGAGNRMYGLEVCKSLHLDSIFLDRAYDLRRKYFEGTGGTLSHKQSHYNSGKIRGQCEFCGEFISEEIHHMIPQELADENGYIQGGSLHKNHKANLASLCRKCHKKEHSIMSDITDELTATKPNEHTLKTIRKKTTTNKCILSKR